MAKAFAPYIKAFEASLHTKLGVLKSTPGMSIGVGKVEDHVRPLWEKGMLHCQ